MIAVSQTVWQFALVISDQLIFIFQAELGCICSIILCVESKSWRVPTRKGPDVVTDLPCFLSDRQSTRPGGQCSARGLCSPLRRRRRPPAARQVHRPTSFAEGSEHKMCTGDLWPLEERPLVPGARPGNRCWMETTLQVICP